MSKLTFSNSDISDLLKIAEAAAYEVGNYLLKMRGQAKIEQQKSSRDDLLDIDLLAEKIILNRLHTKTPDIGTLSEEAGHEGRQEAYWLIDPLDGSANFQHRNPTFGVALAFVVDKTTVGAVIYLPTNGEMFTAVQNQGAYVNGTRIHTSKTSILEDAIIHIGDIMKEGKPEITNQRLQDISKLFTQARRIRMIGSAATDLAYIACGRADILVNHAKKPWDREAGKLLVLEAGGNTTNYQRQDEEFLFVYSNGFIHPTAENLFASRY
ncbi:MAG: inositol monophosphatase [Ktedonobacteraceae bacterium]|nr:inositol monophosphatase [Ktedonobacteraceae bacterium]